MLNAYLDFYRAALKDRAFGLSHDQLQLAHPPATLTLARLIGHMTMVEYVWFRDRFDGHRMVELFDSLNWDADTDAEMTLAQTWPVEELFERFDTAIDDSRARSNAAASLDAVSARTNHEGEHWSLRWIMIHMIEEYARHCGHADLIREAIDGDVAS